MTAEGLKATWGRRAVLASAIALIGFTGPARAQDALDLVDLKVVDRETGQALPLWRHDGRLFVAGEQGARYSLRVTNHTGGRVLVVLSVDGVNIISGETARYDERGHVLGPYGSYDLKGWRKSETEVAAFAFTALPRSYAALTGRPGDVGVIGMAVFRERPPSTVTPLAIAPPPPSRAEQRSEPSRGAAGKADAAPPPPLPIPPVEKPIARAPSAGQLADRSEPNPGEAKLGTVHGALEWSVSHTVPFVRATPYPQLVRQIEYDSRANLILAGVIPGGSDRPPRAFPGAGAAPGFVPDPPARF
ncbi:MAG: hypothetical protein ACXWKT_15080 [Caulobacteraceae bacterium]